MWRSVRESCGAWLAVVDRRHSGCRRSAGIVLLALVGLTLLPGVARAQSAISGVIRDVSGAVLPGVTVEASSPVLIEKTRSVTSNETGRYTLVDLRPGTYKLTFTLAGFSTLVRDNVELPGNTTVPINVELRVGALEESITVSGSSMKISFASTGWRMRAPRTLVSPSLIFFASRLACRAFRSQRSPSR